MEPEGQYRLSIRQTGSVSRFKYTSEAFFTDFYRQTALFTEPTHRGIKCYRFSADEPSILTSQTKGLFHPSG